MCFSKKRTVAQNEVALKREDPHAETVLPKHQRALRQKASIFVSFCAGAGASAHRLQPSAHRCRRRRGNTDRPNRTSPSQDILQMQTRCQRYGHKVRWMPSSITDPLNPLLPDSGGGSAHTARRLREITAAPGCGIAKPMTQPHHTKA